LRPVQVIPSAEVVSVPDAPPATYVPPPYVKALIAFDENPDVRAVHVIASGDVVIVPAPPPATHSVPPYVTELIMNVPNPDVRDVQVTPSVGPAPFVTVVRFDSADK
jgi:hypothetical protein